MLQICLEKTTFSYLLFRNLDLGFIYLLAHFLFLYILYLSHIVLYISPFALMMIAYTATEKYAHILRHAFFLAAGYDQNSKMLETV